MKETGRQNWSAFDKWHLLFDDLCNRSGYYDNAGLGSRYCSRLGRRGEAHFGTAVRNLSNWRSGKHIPRQRNFMILSQLLDIGGDPALSARWHELYVRAREAEGEGAGRSDNGPEVDRAGAEAGFAAADTMVPPQRSRTGPRFDVTTALVGLVFFCAGILSGEVYRAEPWLWFQSASRLPLIVWRPHVSLVVGESLVIHGERGDCGKPPPDWEYVLTRLPISRIGSFSDGGVVRRNSNFCRGETPARAVTFTAEKAGVEELLVLGDVMRVTVVTGAP